MKHIIYTNIFLFFLVLFTSCEKVIDIDVKESDKKLVIEGVITNEQGGCMVRISKTKALTAGNEPDAVSGAFVQIKDDKGMITQLQESLPGTYRSAIIGVPGNTYELTVNIAGQVFKASSKMPKQVAIDSLYVSYMEMLGEKEYTTNITYTDPVEKGNAYRFVQYQNGKKNKMFTIVNDDISNGKKNTITYFNTDEELKKGDHIRVELQSIDASVYKYWYSLWQGATGDGNAASPANPVSNISGGSLGYFSAQTVNSRSTVIQ